MGREDLPQVKGDAGKASKKFLAQKDAVELAFSIAKIQEEKASSKVNKSRNRQGSPAPKGRQKISASRVKQNEAKAVLAAQQARKKRDKAKLRKARWQAQLSNATEGAATSTPRKKVSFV